MTDHIRLCQGVTTRDKPCGLPAGWGTDNEDYCKHHIDQDTDDGEDPDIPSRYALELVGDVDHDALIEAFGADATAVEDGTISVIYPPADGGDGEPEPEPEPDPEGPFTAVADGRWDDASTWEQRRVPMDGYVVFIPRGTTVTVASEVETRAPLLVVEGTLRHAPAVDTQLRAETIQVDRTGRYEVGAADAPIARDASARVEFIDEGPIDETEWPDRENKGLLAYGYVAVNGAQKTPWTTLASPPAAGDTELSLDGEPTAWAEGDEIVIPGVRPNANEDEKRTIAAIQEQGRSVTLDTSLDHDHVPPADDLDTYALNLSRNVVFESENTATDRRGHVMVMSAGTEFRYARFDELGRTDKNEYLTNPVRGGETLPDGLAPNPSARYALHWHMSGIDADEPHHAAGVVITGSPGWGVVNHHAYAHVTDSITYDVLGAGFVAEGGNERGSFERCFAVRSEGSGDVIDSRSAGVHGAHGDTPAIDDFGHAGHGFWLQSPLVEVVDCVAAGHRHQAFVWWLRPLLDGRMAEGRSIDDSRVTFWPNTPLEYVDTDRIKPMIEAIERGRFAGSDTRDRLMRETQKIPSTFAPVARISGNEAFASGGGVDFSRHNFKWKHERYGDFNPIGDLTVYNIGAYVDADGEEHSPDLPRHKASGHQGRGGNVGVSFRYTSNVALRDSRILGSGRENSVGVPYHDYLWTTIVANCTIAGWEWGVGTGEHELTWIRDCGFDGNEYDVHWSFDNTGPAILERNDLDRVRHKFEYINEKGSEVLTFGQEYGVRIDGRTSHVRESDPEFVPFPDADRLGGVNNIEDIESVDDERDLIGLTNAEMLDEYGICISGGLLPDDAVEEPFVDGALLDPAEPRDPPPCVWLDAESGDLGGGFSAVSNAEASTGSCIYSEGSSDPPADGEAATYSFTCAAGTYRVYGRAWPDAWNGDTVYCRVDGGDWVASPKWKSPTSFQWHDVDDSDGDIYEFDLDAGEHTVEIAVPNDEVLIDRLCLVADTTVIGAYGGD